MSNQTNAGRRNCQCPTCQAQRRQAAQLRYYAGSLCVDATRYMSAGCVPDLLVSEIAGALFEAHLMSQDGVVWS